jgi:MraZ protein
MVKNGEKDKSLSTAQTRDLQLFLGEYQPNITGGARIALPKKIRQVVGNEKSIILIRGFEECISGYTKDYWQKESEKALESSVSDRKSRLLKRYMFSGAFELEFDSQGRVVIPKSLMDYANLKDGETCTFIGAGDHFEIWNKEKWDSSLLSIEKEIS